MPISNEILTEIKSDFNGGDNETLRFINTEEAEIFWNWFKQNATKIELSDNPNQQLINDKNIAGRCFGNAQTIALSSSYYTYCEGFAKICGNFTFHGFTIKDGKALDYTALSNKNEFKDFNGELPSEYYGVIIPLEFIKERNRELINQEATNIPFLVYHYFRTIIQA